MKKILIVAFLIILAVLIYKFRGFKGSLPAVLPPKELPKNTEVIPNNLGLNLPPGFAISVFARDLNSPRVLAVDPKGTVITSVPGEGKIIALPDNDKNGKADKNIVVKDGLDRPHGLTFKDGKLYVAELRRILRYDYNADNFQVSGEKHIADLPGGGRHNTRSIGFGKNGRLYVSVGSTCDVCVEKDGRNGSILEVNVESGESRIFASGLRNSVFLTIHPDSNKIYAAEMGRDFLGDNLPPEEVNFIEDGANYGWPFCYGDKVVDKKFSASGDCTNTRAPFYKMCAHCAPLGLTFIKSDKLPKDWQGDLLVSLHGSWNSSVPVGYKVIRVDVDSEKAVGESDFVGGFLDGNQVSGRPVDLIFGEDDSLYLSDDKAGVIYKISYQP